MNRIDHLKAREILDSRGHPTLEVEVELESGTISRASVPSGASTGSREALELRDNDKSRYGGKGVTKAVQNVQEVIAPEIVGMDVCRQMQLDNLLKELDGTENKSHLGANAMLGVSMAVAKSASKLMQIPMYQYLGGVGAHILPVPQMNVINGGAHAKNNLDIQEFLIMPVGSGSFPQALRAGAEVFHALKSILAEQGHVTSVGDEGGFAPNLKENREAFSYIVKAIQKAGYNPGEDVVVGIDAAASGLYKGGKYRLRGENKSLSSGELIDYYQDLCSEFPIFSIEDGLAENDWGGWESLTQKLGKKIQIVGDDIFVTNPEILSQGIHRGVGNSVLVKLNQIGTVSETLQTVELSKKSGYSNVISHRSGETEDHFIADLAVAVNSGQIKTGSLSRSDRLAKYNQLLRIQDDLGEQGKYNGPVLLDHWGK